MASPGLIVLGIAGQSYWFLGVYLMLATTDWLDGKLAVFFDQRSDVGPRLDTAADVMLFVCLLAGGAWLTWDALQTEQLFLILGVATYAVSIGVALWKFRRFPAYHTRAAKTCWLLIPVGSVLLFATGATWMMRAALIAVVLTNIEATLISFVLPESATNIASVWHALQRRKRTARE